MEWTAVRPNSSMAAMSRESHFNQAFPARTRCHAFFITLLPDNGNLFVVSPYLRARAIGSLGSRVGSRLSFSG